MIMVARADRQTRGIAIIEEETDIELMGDANKIKTHVDPPQADADSFQENGNHAAYDKKISYKNPTSASRFPAQLTVATDKTNPTVVRPKHRSANLLPIVDQEDILPKHRMLADQVLRALPSACRDNLRQFFVTYEKNPKNRGLGGESTIIVTGTVPDPEFMALIVHECGHVTDLGGMRGSRESGSTTFVDGNTPMFADDPSVEFYLFSWSDAVTTKRGSVAKDFVSGYAQSDPYEDFAESFAFFALHKNQFKAIARRSTVLQAKYDFLERIVFADTPVMAEGKSTVKSIPWDVTKLPYEWHAAR